MYFIFASKVSYDTLFFRPVYHKVSLLEMIVIIRMNDNFQNKKKAFAFSSSLAA